MPSDPYGHPLCPDCHQPMKVQDWRKFVLENAPMYYCADVECAENRLKKLKQTAKEQAQ